MKAAAWWVARQLLYVSFGLASMMLIGLFLYGLGTAAIFLWTNYIDHYFFEVNRVIGAAVLVFCWWLIGYLFFNEV